MMLTISTISWVAVALVCVPATWRMIFGGAGDHDAVKFSYFMVAVVILGFSLRWYFAPDSQFLLDAMRGANTVLSLFLLAIIRFYRK